MKSPKNPEHVQQIMTNDKSFFFGFLFFVVSTERVLPKKYRWATRNTTYLLIQMEEWNRYIIYIY